MSIPRSLGAATLRSWLMLAALCLPAAAQTTIDLRTQGRNVDFSGATSTKPFRTGTVLPATCGVGEAFYKTDAPAGSNLFGCVSANNWAVLSGGDSLPAPVNGALLSNDGNNPVWSPAGGDVAGPPGQFSVQAIRGVNVAPGTPANGQTLVYDSVNGRYEARPVVQGIQGGVGVLCSSNAGQSTCQTDDAVVPRYLTGSGVPTAQCVSGRDFYLDTAGGGLYYCASGNQWQAATGMPFNRPNNRRWTMIEADGDAVLGVVGDTLTLQGTAVAALPSGNEPARVEYTTAASANSDAGIHGAAIYRTGRKTIVQAYAEAPVVTDIRVWIGVGSVTALSGFTGTDTPAAHYAAFRYSSAVDSTWKCVTGNGISSTVLDSTVGPAGGREFEVQFDDAGSRILFAIDGVVRCTAETNLPGAGQNLRLVAGARTLAAAAKPFRLGWMYAESER